MVFRSGIRSHPGHFNSGLFGFTLNWGGQREAKAFGIPPIPAREIILTAQIMDEIFNQLYPSKPEA